MSSLQIVVRCTTWMVANGSNEDHDVGKDDQNEEEEWVIKERMKETSKQTNDKRTKCERTNKKKRIAYRKKKLWERVIQKNQLI